TDGEDNGSKTTLPSAIESAQRSDTLVFSILFEDPEANYGGFGGPGMGRRRGGMGRGYPVGGANNGKKILQQISLETGGRFFEVSRTQTITKVFSLIEEDLRNQYSLGYTPDRNDRNSLFRHIHLATKQKGFTVQTREGYYPS